MDPSPERTPSRRRRSGRRRRPDEPAGGPPAELTEEEREHVAGLRDRLGELTLSDEHRLGAKLERLTRTRDPERRAADAVKVIDEFARAAQRIERRRVNVPAVSYPPQLPVSARREDLLEAIAANQIIVVAGETGSGKTTQLPKLCLELGRGVRGMIAHTQPRRLAARTVAQRIADELDTELGTAIGYAVRFTDQSREDTLVRLVTDGLLLAEIRNDRMLRRYDTIILDEAHERSLNIDFLLGYLARLLPRRPDLKLIITSATIDPQRFAEHFGGAPIVEVSGRTFPVEVRYRPPAEERDQADAIADAIEELEREPAGDVLVFLSGEREIRDTAELLAGRLGPRTEVLPLYARLSSAEQQRVFRPSTDAKARRRVVLATNVAETSLTVPGIRYVVDPGTARISRYSARLKVQQLPIEPISQASANQRKGRCGRTADGICIRLFDEEDFENRPEFTDPEILRTSLASVILQMAAQDLGSVADFPFLDPPDRRQVRDGLNLLHELGALAKRGDEDGAGTQLTEIGRRLAQLPVDPRLARMILEADKLHCAEEVIVLAAALSIQDPRERPVEKRAQADQQHARFKDENSDFITYMNLWDHVSERRRELSGSALRRLCKAEFLNYLRIREWQDLAGQLRSISRGAGVKLNDQPAEPPQIHRAMLAGLLSHVGVRDGKTREYEGARGGRFAVFPGSVIARKPPGWVMVAELVETTRLWGRVAAAIDPAWIEPLAGDLVKRTHSEPRWERRRGAVVATERVTLYGLPIVTSRKVAYATIDPELSRELFLRKALVEGDWETRHHFFAANRQLLEEVDELEQRARRRDLLVDDHQLYAFYDARVPQEVVSGAHFDRWWKEERRSSPDLLTFTKDVVIDPAAAAALDERARPEVWREGELELALTYRFEPGTEQDGVTAHVPVRGLGQVDGAHMDWLVPGLRGELVTALIRMLPKEIRRGLVPIPDLAAQALERLDPSRGTLGQELARALQELRGVQVSPKAFDLDRLPPYLRMRYRVEDDEGRVLGESEDLAALREQARPKLRAALAAATPDIERSGLTDWSFGDVPATISLPGTGTAVRAFPALVDEGKTVGIRVLDTQTAAQHATRAGVRRLLALTLPSPRRALREHLGANAQLALATAPHGSLDAVLDDVIEATINARADRVAGAPRTQAEFSALRERVGANLERDAIAVLDLVVAIFDARRAVERVLDGPSTPAMTPARQDVARQLGRLVFNGFVTATGPARLGDVVRYLQGAAQRIERLPDTLATDRDRMNAVLALEAEYQSTLAHFPAGEPVPRALAEVPWLLEELRMEHFARGLGVRGQASAKRIRKVIEADAPPLSAAR